MALDTGILYMIAGGCAVFGVITAYLIYNHVQQEKADYYRNKKRRETLKKDPANYDYSPTKDKKRPPSEPMVAAAVPAKEIQQQRRKTDEKGLTPVPAPLLAPVVLPPVPHPTPPVSDTTPLIKNDANNYNASTNNYNASTNTVNGSPGGLDNIGSSSNSMMPLVAPVAAATVGGAAVAGVGAGAFAAYEMSPMRSEPQPEKTPEKENKKKKEKKKHKESGDFDDYRHFSPTALPPPKGKIPPQANYSAGYAQAQAQAPPEVVPPDEMAPPVVERHTVSDKTLRLPRVAVVNREGLLF